MPTDVVNITADNPVAVDPLNPVHDVRNPREWNQRAVSLHVYSRPFDSCIVYSVEQGSCGEIGLQYTSNMESCVENGITTSCEPRASSHELRASSKNVVEVQVKPLEI